ncbi:MAG: sulfotransferase [Cyanobacteria bacterium P01_D01_bin.1]
MTVSESAAMIANPIFLVGSERSGTTLLRLMLNFHPQITWLNEFEYAVTMMDDQNNPPALADYYEWLSTHRIFQMSKMTIDRTLDYPALVNDFLRQRKETFNKPIIGATVHHHFDRLPAIWPEAKFIHIVRDPRDVSRSCVVKGWAGNVWNGLDRWVKAEAIWDKLGPLLPDDRKLEVRYQDLIADNRAVMDQVCDFIGVEYSPEMMDYVHTTDYGLPDPKLVQGWQRKLSPREIQLVEERVGDKMVERGFSLSDYEKIELSPLDRLRLNAQNWFAKVSFKVKRYGLGIFIGDFVTRKLGLRQLNRSYKLKINQIQISQLKKSW